MTNTLHKLSDDLRQGAMTQTVNSVTSGESMQSSAVESMRLKALELAEKINVFTTSVHYLGNNSEVQRQILGEVKNVDDFVKDSEMQYIDKHATTWLPQPLTRKIAQLIIEDGVIVGAVNTQGEGLEGGRDSLNSFFREIEPAEVARVTGIHDRTVGAVNDALNGNTDAIRDLIDGKNIHDADVVRTKGAVTEYTGNRFSASDIDKFLGSDFGRKLTIAADSGRLSSSDVSTGVSGAAGAGGGVGFAPSVSGGGGFRPSVSGGGGFRPSVSGGVSGGFNPLAGIAVPKMGKVDRVNASDILGKLNSSGVGTRTSGADSRSGGGRFSAVPEKSAGGFNVVGDRSGSRFNAVKPSEFDATKFNRVGATGAGSVGAGGVSVPDLSSRVSSYRSPYTSSLSADSPLNKGVDLSGVGTSLSSFKDAAPNSSGVSFAPLSRVTPPSQVGTGLSGVIPAVNFTGAGAGGSGAGVAGMPVPPAKPGGVGVPKGPTAGTVGSSALGSQASSAGRVGVVGGAAGMRGMGMMPMGMMPGAGGQAGGKSGGVGSGGVDVEVKNTDKDFMARDVGAVDAVVDLSGDKDVEEDE